MVAKYALLFGWSLILLFMVLFVIRNHPFIRRRKEPTLNLSEAIYAVGLLASAVVVLTPALEILASDYDISQKLYADKFLWNLIESGSLVSLAGIAIFLLFVLTSRGLSTLIFAKRLPLIEFNANNISYALLRAGLLLSVSILLSQFCRPVFQAFLPTITTPFYG